MNRALRNLALPAATVVAAVVLSACGSTTNSASPGNGGMPGMNSSSTNTAQSTTGAPASGPHNAADVSFATEMIPHHAQAVTMAEVAATQATAADIKALATAITSAQGPEIQQMSGWLAGWGAPVPVVGDHNMSAMGGDTMDGMMSDQEMSDLGNATGAAFDRMWLQLMTTHHDGAIAMSKTELSAGQNSDAKKLAQSIIDGQTAEIATMKSLLPAVPAS